MSVMTTTTFRAAGEIGPLTVIIGYDGVHDVVREVRRYMSKHGEQATLVCVDRDYDYPVGYMVEIVVVDPNARVTTHIDDVAPGDIAIMLCDDRRFPRPVEVMVEVTEVTAPRPGRSGRPVQTVHGRTSTGVIVDVTLDADDGQLDVVGNVADSDAAQA